MPDGPAARARLPHRPSAAERFLQLPLAERKHALRAIKTDADFEALLYDWSFWARPQQLPPPGWDWITWGIIAGRGAGKTRCAAEFVRAEVESGRSLHPILIGADAGDVRDVMVEGESGILAIAPRWSRPKYEPSKRRLTWPNGVVGHLFGAHDPDSLRGPQSDLIWCDEIAKWKYATQAWDNAVLGNRLGAHPRRVFTTTPKPIRLVRLLMGKDPSQRGHPPDPSVVLAEAMSTYDNLGNLAPSFIQEILSKYEGTRLGRQELHGHLLEDIPGALWTLQMIEDARSFVVPATFVRIVVAIDPAVTAHEESNETGIIVCAKDEAGLGWVLRDVSGRYTTDQWAAKAIEMYHHYHADRVVAEVNNGGDLVETVLRSKNADISYKSVNAARGKLTRAEPISALYERRMVRHYGEFPELEDQMTTYAPDQIPTAEQKRKEKSISPDRMDAMVWGLSELMLRKGGLFVA
ncbi:MAG TPA: terminase family protein [Gemmatimonadaceae bacterium]|nr:terminase family protein [Gemmatimonadaceae bacterium]